MPAPSRKKLTGRAKKRLLYNRRIKDAQARVDPSTGLMRGPNQRIGQHSGWRVDGAVDKETALPRKSGRGPMFGELRAVSSGPDLRQWDVRSHHRKTKGSTGMAISAEKTKFNRNAAAVASLYVD
jgi:hypothetical protein